MTGHLPRMTREAEDLCDLAKKKRPAAPLTRGPRTSRPLNAPFAVKPAWRDAPPLSKTIAKLRGLVRQSRRWWGHRRLVERISYAARGEIATNLVIPSR